MCFADGDDLFTNDYIERLVITAEKTNSEIVICDFLDFDNKSNLTFRSYGPYFADLVGKTYDLNSETRKLFLKLNPVPWRKIYRMDFLKEHHIRFDECDYFFEDNSFHWFNILAANRISVIFDKLVWHRMNRAGQTMKASEASLLGMLYQHDVIFNYISKNGLKKEFKKDCLDWLIRQAVYVSDNVSVDNLQALFSILKEKFDCYKLSDIRKYTEYVDCDFKIKSLIYSIKTNNYQMFFDLITCDGKNPFYLPLRDNIKINLKLCTTRMFMQKCIKHINLRLFPEFYSKENFLFRLNCVNDQIQNAARSIELSLYVKSKIANK